ncbi:hypothetical protein [Streptomyces sp. NPDC004721]
MSSELGGLGHHARPDLIVAGHSPVRTESRCDAATDLHRGPLQPGTGTSAAEEVRRQLTDTVFAGSDRTLGGGMSGSISAIVVAILGIGGTLASALLTQRGADRVRKHELEHARQLRHDEREYARHEAQLEARRTTYAALNAVTRDYINVMSNVLHAMEAGEVTDDLRSELDRARRDHRLCHAEAQMIMPDPVMNVASTVNRGFGDLYGELKRLDRGVAGQDESVATVREDMRKLWDALWAMRLVMRVDLGITTAET